jgi:hypothetical protein
VIPQGHREWLGIVSDLSESDLPCNVSTVAYAVGVARNAVEAYDSLLALVMADRPTGPNSSNVPESPL